MDYSNFDFKVLTIADLESACLIGILDSGKALVRMGVWVSSWLAEKTGYTSSLAQLKLKLSLTIKSKTTYQVIFSGHCVSYFSFIPELSNFRVLLDFMTSCLETVRSKPSEIKT